MKKLVALILVLVQLGIGVGGYASVSKHCLLNEVEKADLYELGIMVGDEAGELHLEDTITRAEAVKMICVAGGIQPEAPAGQTCSFPDVAESHWAYPYLCAVQSRGMICGDEAGNFNPEHEITNEEIVKIIVCLLGYDVRAEETGGYPGGYTREAERLGITTGLLLDVNVPALRNDVGVMIVNALDIPLMEDVGEGESIIANGQNGMVLKTLRLEITGK